MLPVGRAYDNVKPINLHKMILIELKDKVWVATLEGGMIEFDNELPVLFKRLERRASEFQKEALNQRNLEQCECGKICELSEGRMDDDACWHCPECIEEEDKEWIARELSDKHDPDLE